MMSLIITVIMLSTSACSKNQKIETKRTEQKQWISIALETGDGEFTIYDDGDSIIYKNWDYVPLGEVNGWVREFKKVNERIKRGSVSQVEKDSIYSWVYSLVNTPKKPLRFCSDYVGRFNAIINLNRLPSINQACEYISICDWRTMNSETKALHQLLSTKFPELNKK